MRSGARLPLQRSLRLLVVEHPRPQALKGQRLYRLGQVPQFLQVKAELEVPLVDISRLQLNISQDVPAPTTPDFPTLAPSTPDYWMHDALRDAASEGP